MKHLAIHVTALGLAASLALGCGDDAADPDGGHPTGDGGNPAGDGGGADPDANLACNGAMPDLALEEVGAGLDLPLYVTSPPGDAASLYVVEKAGLVRILRDGAILPTPFLDIRARVNIPGESAEGGLLGLAFAPDYASSGRFFVYYTEDGASGERAVVQELARSAADPDVASATPVQDIIDAPHGGWNHAGGTIAFGPDGYLYVGIGDGAISPSPAPDLDERLGKLLRVDVDDPGTPPPDNLAGGDPYIWDYGLRNPWRFSFDRADGTLYIGDVGEQDYEEINVEPAGEGGRDYGWDRMEGMHCLDEGCTPSGTLPAIEHDHDATGAIVGGHVYRGAAIPCLRGRYVYADYSYARILSFVWDGDQAVSPIDLTDDLDDGSLDNIASMGEDADGELYLVLIGDGRILRIVEE